MAVGFLDRGAVRAPVHRWRTGHRPRQLVWDLRTCYGLATFPSSFARVTGRARSDIDEFAREATELARSLERYWISARRFQPALFTLSIGKALYVLARSLQPRVMVETGVWRGVSSAFLLGAMERNGVGRLYSIDLPTFDPRGRVNSDGKADLASVPDRESVGDLVPTECRARWELRLGDARALLPDLLRELGRIDLFLHDSEHSYDHMTFEYNLAWAHLVEGGWLLSDDVSWSTETRKAWTEFVLRVGGTPYRFFARDGNYGLLRKGAGTSRADESTRAA